MAVNASSDDPSSALPKEANTEFPAAPPPRVPPPFNLTFPSSLSPWNKSVRQWFTDNDKYWNGLAVGALVFNPTNRILLIQRAAHDSMPNLWETPGGAADATDATLLEAAARELWEETGLVACGFRRSVTEGEGREPGSLFTNRTGSRIFCRFSFEVDVLSWEEVRVDPEEHQDYLWVTEEEVRAGKVGERSFTITNRQMKALILEGFRLRRVGGGETAGDEGA